MSEPHPQYSFQKHQHSLPPPNSPPVVWVRLIREEVVDDLEVWVEVIWRKEGMAPQKESQKPKPQRGRDRGALCYGLNMRYPPKFMYWGLGCQLMGFGK
jgi:hypothetical protein